MTPPGLLWYVMTVESCMTSPGLLRNIRTPGSSGVEFFHEIESNILNYNLFRRPYFRVERYLNFEKVNGEEGKKVPPTSIGFWYLWTFQPPMLIAYLSTKYVGD
ncbi:hypothetical protein ACFE04_019794 [Oxalis oulophora]